MKFPWRLSQKQNRFEEQKKYNDTIFIIGGGPSVKTSALHFLGGQRIITVNTSYKLFEDSIIWFGDVQWWKWFGHDIRNRKVATCNPSSSIKKESEGMDIRFFQKGKPYGIEERPGFVSWNGNSGASAINLAYHLGAKRCILVGFDMNAVGGKNFHTEYEDRGKSKYTEKRLKETFNRHMKGFSVIKKDAENLNIEIINATPGSSIKEFPITKLEALF